MDKKDDTKKEEKSDNSIPVLPIIEEEENMDNQGINIKRIKALEITQAYAEYKTRHTGDLDSELINWTYNIKRR